MKELRPNFKWVRTQSGWDLQIRVVLPRGYELTSPQPDLQLTDPDRLSLDLVPNSKSQGGTQEVLIPFSKLPAADLVVDLEDGSGKRVGGGKVVAIDDSDEK